MRLLLGSVLVATFLVACAASDSVIVVSGDGGVADAAASSSCTVQPDSDSISLCGSATTTRLFSCKEGTAPPGTCAKALLPNAYCCGTTDTMSDGGTDTGTKSGVNPYGVPYPTDNIGTNARSGSQRGDRVKNHNFQGYQPSSSTLGKVALADFYDPQGKKYDAVVMVGATLWSSVDQPTLNAISGSTRRIATVAVLGEGTSPGTPATLTNLATFRTKNTFAATGLDAGFTMLGVYFDAAAVPFVMVIDARTMEIASAAVGGLTSASQIDAAVDDVMSRPAAY
jgi:hypothetical protein